MDEYIPVSPTDVVRSCVKVRMQLDFRLKATNCYVNVQKFDASNTIIDVCNVFIDDSEYSQWSYDDDYIIDLVLTKLGLTREEVLVES